MKKTILKKITNRSHAVPRQTANMENQLKFFAASTPERTICGIEHNI